MFVVQLLSVFVIVQSAWTLTVVEEKLLNSVLQLQDIFGDLFDDITVGYQKPETAVGSINKKKILSSIVAPIESSRADHYWTRKRGRDKVTPPASFEEVYYNLNTSRWAERNNKGWRRKREALSKLSRLNQNYFRPKRRVEIDDPNAQDPNNETLISNTSFDNSTEKYESEHQDTTSNYSKPARKQL